jgi:hypothetical protein
MVDVGTFTNGSTGTETKVELSINEKDKSYRIWIEGRPILMSRDGEGGIMLNSKQHRDFYETLSRVKTTYQSWIKTAVENNVKDVTTEMKDKVKTDTYFMYGSKYRFDLGQNLSFSFRVVEVDGKVYQTLIMKSGTLQASDNQYMTHSGIFISFYTPEDLQSFIDLLSMEKIGDLVNKQLNQKDLFKQE